MTAENEVSKSSYHLSNNGGVLFLPDWCLDDLINLAVPSEADLFTEDSAQKYPISTQLKKNGVLYRYSKAGAAMGAARQGFLKINYTQVPGKAGNSVGCGFEGAPYAAVAAGDTMIEIADTAATKNLYEGALLTIYNDTDSMLDEYRIIGNDASTGVYTKLYIAPPGFKAALTTSMAIDVYLNEYANVRSAVSIGLTYCSAIGYAKFPITSGAFFWLHTAGRISGVTGASTWPGQTAFYRDVYANTDGSLIGYTAGYQRIGFLLHRTASDYGDNTIMLQLDQ